jgi:hypothetical protein
MSFSRSHRNDRRRRVIRESIAADSDFAVESARAQRKARRAAVEDRSETFHIGYRDPGYSQAVRKTCQQRLTQFIPIRPGSLALVLGVMWCLWGALLLAHYLFHVRGTTTGQSQILLLQLFDVRSPHSIANWLTCQVWMLTAIAAWMIYRIRQHKLDDYRAKYRIWIVLACIALFSCFDTATSALYLLGQSIDPWTRKEIGYGGWPLVLACYASLVALMGLRLSSELKGTPTAVIFWFAGLLAWACAALLGTGLLKLEWHPGTIDLTVGACWLGGVLLVFQAAGMYLRHCYLQAQKRFIERSVAAPSQLRIGLPKMPSMPWSRGKSMDPYLEGSEETTEEDEQDEDDGVLDTIPKKSWLPWRRGSAGSDETIDDRNQADRSATKRSDVPKEPKRPMRLFGLIPSRAESNELLAGEAIAEDEGEPIDPGLTKKSGWFGIGGNRSKEPQPRSTAAVPPKTVAKADSTQKDPKSKSQQDTKSDAVAAKRQWLPSFGRSKKPADNQAATKKTTEGTVSKPATPIPSDSPSTKTKSSWFSLRKPSTDAASPPKAKDPKPPKAKPAASSDEKATKRIAARVFSWLDGLKLKPPVDDAASMKSKSSTTGSNATPQSVASSNVPFPSTSVKPPSPPSQNDDDDDGSNDYRNLSKAERKRLRRQQGNDRYAA